MRTAAEINAMLDKALDRFEQCDPCDPKRTCQAMTIRALNWVLGATPQPLVARVVEKVEAVHG